MIKKIKRVVKRDKVRELIESTGTTFFTVEFIKANGQLRKLNGRLNVKVHLHGGKNTVRKIDKYITVFDVHAGNYRNVNLETIQTVTVWGKKYEVM